MANIGITAVGCPGASTFLKQLIQRFPSDHFYGFDSDPFAVGRYICHHFSAIPPAQSPEFIATLEYQIKKYRLDLLWVINSRELLPVATWCESMGEAEYDGCKIIAQTVSALNLSENKRNLYETCALLSLPHPQYRVFTNASEFLKSHQDLTASGVKSLCFKPSVSSGSRGFRYIRSQVAYSSEYEQLISKKPASETSISYEQALRIFNSVDSFPEMLLMEEVTGQNIDAMAFCAQYPSTTSRPLLRSQKTREKSRSGVITFGTHIFNPDIDYTIEALVSRLGLTGFNGFQFIGKYLIEINPRVSSFVYTDDWCEPAFALEYYLGRSTPLELAEHQSRYPIGAHLLRYFDCITNLTPRS